MPQEANQFDQETKAQATTEQESVTKDTNESPTSNKTTEELQDDAGSSPALDDPEIDRDVVQTLPGTGGPDDEGTIEVDPKDLNL